MDLRGDQPSNGSPGKPKGNGIQANLHSAPWTVSKQMTNPIKTRLHNAGTQIVDYEHAHMYGCKGHVSS